VLLYSPLNTLNGLKNRNYIIIQTNHKMPSTITYETNFTDYEEASWSPHYRVNNLKGLIIDRKGKVIGSKSNDYFLSCINSTTKGNHVWIYTHAYGEIEEDHDIDHINGDKSDNRLINLEEVTHKENCKRAATLRKAKALEIMESSRPPVARPVIAIPYDDPEDGLELYPSIYNCSKTLNINPGLISQCCAGQNHVKSGKSKNDGRKYFFMFAE
jgi:hypothetical protein